MPDNIAVLRQSLSDAVSIDRNALRYVLDQSSDCIKILDPGGHIEYINSEGRCALEIADFDQVCGTRWPDLWPDESQSSIDQTLARARRGLSTEVEAWRSNTAGERTWWRISVSPLVEPTGELTAILTISRNVTSDVKVREAQETLALEMRHRLRNAYTIASAIVMQSARTDAENRAFAETVCARLADVALSQTRLLDAGDRTWALPELLATLVEAHGEGASRMRFAGTADVDVDGHQAMLIALVVGELTNNSLKYGALRNHKQVVLSWVFNEPSLTLLWRESLKGCEHGFQSRDGSSGYSLMNRMARNQKAAFEHAVSDDELRVTLTLPM